MRWKTGCEKYGRGIGRRGTTKEKKKKEEVY